MKVKYIPATSRGRKNTKPVHYVVTEAEPFFAKGKTGIRGFLGKCSNRDGAWRTFLFARIVEIDPKIIASIAGNMEVA